MTVYDDLSRAFQDFGDSFEGKKVLISGQLGYKDSSNLYAVKEPTDQSQYRVRLENRSFVTAYHNGVCAPEPDLEVWLEIDSLNRYIINSVNLTGARTSKRTNPSQIFTAPHSHGRGSGMEFPIDTRLFSPFQMRVITGLQLYINAGAYEYEGKWSWFGGATVNLTSSVPATPSRHRWVMLSLDHATASITVTNGVLQSTASPLTNDQIESIISADIPIGAVKLRDGQTGISEIDMESLHILVKQQQRHNFTATSDPLITDDETKGYAIDSRWFNQTTTKMFTCFDASVTAAVWISGGGGGGGGDPISTSSVSTIAKVPIETITLGAPGSILFTVPAGYVDLEIHAVLRSTRPGFNEDVVSLLVNGDNVLANYRYQRGVFVQTSIIAQQGDNNLIAICPAATALAGEFGEKIIETKNYLGSQPKKLFSREIDRISAVVQATGIWGLWWESINAITSLELRATTGNNFVTGSTATLYGYRTTTVITAITGGGGSEKRVPLWLIKW